MKRKLSPFLLIAIWLCAFRSEIVLAQQTTSESSESNSSAPSEVTAPEPKTTKKRKKKNPPLYYSSLGLGKTLPEGFFRFRAINRFAQGNRTVDAKGNTENLGYDLAVTASALAVEYGMSDDLSFQLLVPYISKNALAFNKRQFRNSSVSAQNIAALQKLLYGNLQAQKICPDPNACPADTILENELPIVLPTGEIFTLPKGATVGAALQQIPEMVAKSATPVDGSTGMGDVDFGILYSLLSQRNQNLGLGLGIRLPLGKFQNVPRAQRPTGEGLLMTGLRINYDYQPIAPLWISFQNLSEFSNTSARRAKSSLLNPNQLNQADPSSDAAIAAGSDGDPNQQTVTRKGIGQTGMLRFDLGLTMLGSFWQPIALEAIMNYKLGAPEYYGSRQTSAGEQRFSYSFGGKFDGLGLNRPFPGYVRILKETFLKGKNIAIATDSVIVEFALYRNF